MIGLSFIGHVEILTIDELIGIIITPTEPAFILLWLLFAHCYFKRHITPVIDFIKIDGEFVSNMSNDRMNTAIVETINSIGHVAGLKTIGEYAESAEIIEDLNRLGVDFAQGYAIEKPSAA